MCFNPWLLFTEISQRLSTTSYALHYPHTYVGDSVQVLLALHTWELSHRGPDGRSLESAAARRPDLALSGLI